MSKAFTFTIKSSRFDENYNPSENTRITTNFANLARGSNRQENLRNTLAMINNRFNTLVHWDNPKSDRYAVELEIISVEMNIVENGDVFPAIEILKTYIIDKKTQERTEGIVGNNFSSYVRDYDFSVLLLDHNKDQTTFSIPENFGELHGNIFKHFVNSNEYNDNFRKQPVICLSVSSKDIYHRTGNEHPVLGIEYQPNGSSLTEMYFNKMGLKVRYFMPKNSAAPLAFYFSGDLLGDYTNHELISTISTMETFQKIYRPEIYNANSAAGQYYQPDLNHQDHSLTKIVYDREERSQLAIEQGKFTEEHFIKPNKAILEQWSANYAI
ncbi:DUF1852 domain-containing protein [Enterobacter sp. RHBSTW-00994]|uniref:DUF1852 domain-containing protein n=1 Tax=Enterobacter sp. RHBSTW-00994 TaxID=2742676 RepID=UPI0015E9C076|nr:DUF1852 domain-containing protein [Enterobacter sp. RHBSTW-00994]QLR43017.1 DUF1852 domain-containing protein [Enterobacter sp. RHBSTW-00994]